MSQPEPEVAPAPASTSEPAPQPLPQPAEPAAVADPEKASKEEPKKATRASLRPAKEPAPPPTAPASTPAQPAKTKQAKSKALADALAALDAEPLFEKELSATDAGGHGRIIVPKSAAKEYLSGLASGSTLACIDTLGNSYELRFRTWSNNSGYMTLLEGTQELQKRYQTQAGDYIMFAKQKHTGTWVVLGASAKVERPPVPVLSRIAKGGTPDEPKAAAPKATPKSAPAPKAGLLDDKSLEKKRKRMPEGAMALNRPQRGAASKVEHRQDGVFRALPSAVPDPNKVSQLDGTWTATLDLAGELYRAYFETQEQALESFVSAGGIAV